MAALLMFLLVFVSVSAGLTAGYYAFVHLAFRDRVRIRRRLETEFSHSDDQVPKFTLFKNIDQMQLEPSPRMGPDGLDAPVLPTPRSRWEKMRDEMEICGFGFRLRHLLLAAGCLGLALGFLAFWYVGLLVACVAALAGGIAPFLWVRTRIEARKFKLCSQLGDAFQLMARVIRAGQSVTQAFQSIAETSPEPIASEFARCQRQQNLGLSPEETYKEMAQRCDILEMRIFVMAMLIQRQTGGNLADVLDRLAGLLRERFRLRRRVQSLTAEGRLQGLTLFVLPFVLFGAMMIVNRSYAESLLHQVHLLIATGVSMLLGLLWIRRIVNFEP